MANYSVLKAAIQNVIKQNGNNEITGNVLQSALLSLINSIGANYEYVGIATPSTNPGTPDQNVFYLASASGTYTNFGEATVNSGDIVVFKYNGTWQKETIFQSSNFVKIQGILPASNLDTIKNSGIWLLVTNYTYENSPITSGYLRVSSIDVGGGSTWILQEAYGISDNRLYKRSSMSGGSFYSWQEVGKDYDLTQFLRVGGALGSTDINTVSDNGVWLLADNYTYENCPVRAGFLRVQKILGSSWVLQEAYGISDNRLHKRVGQIGGSFYPWQQVGGVSITNEYVFNEYKNTYNNTVSPQITTDTNNYLASTGDNTDRTAAIVAMLQSTGVCKLGPGTFYVDGLEMPDNTQIVGSGPNTKVYLVSGDNKFAIKMGKHCSVKNFALIGANSYTPQSTVGTRHGILWQGNYTQSQSGAQQPDQGIVDSLWISNFAGGGITCYDTGYSTDKAIECTNCWITGCDAGINISYWSEFHKFTNVRTASCYYGCINNGGNNVFVNCDFSSCKEGFLMDNSNNQSPNNSHGSAIGCVFNHSNSNAGVGIRILNCDNGFVFVGCQIFYSQIVIVDSDGVSFSDCNFGASNCDISVTNGGVVLFANNMHQSAPVITIVNNSKIHFVNCYVRSTGDVVSN